MLSSLPKLFRSSSRSRIDDWRKTILLIVLTGDDEVVAYESRLTRDDADEDRRKEVRNALGEKRAVMDWKWDCMIGDLAYAYRCGRSPEDRLVCRALNVML